MKITGFYITANGDPSVGINESRWTLEKDFYFDDQQELEEFKVEIKNLFEFYCGDSGIYIETFEEYQQQIDIEDIEYYKEYPIRYLIRDTGYGSDTFKQSNCCASYSTNVGTAIHNELPRYISEEGDSDTQVIKSTDPRFKEILLKNAEVLEREIRNEEYRLRIAKDNLRLIVKELNIGQKVKK